MVVAKVSLAMVALYMQMALLIRNCVALAGMTGLSPGE